MSLLEDAYDEIIDNIAKPKASLILINRLKKQGDLGNVIKACTNALKYFPDDIYIRGVLAEAYFEQGHTLLADTELSKIVKQINELSYLFKIQADLYRKEGRFEEAIDSLRKYLTHNPGDEEAEQLLFDLVSDSKEDKSALLTPTMAEIYFKQGELEEAINIYRNILKTFPDDQKSIARLDELEKIRREEEDKVREANIREVKLKTINALEKWLENIQSNRESANI